MGVKQDDDMRYASLDVPWSGDEEVQRTVRMRWYATALYLVAVILATLVPFMLPDMDEGSFAIVYSAVVVVGTVLLIAVLSRPLLRPPGPDVTVMEGLARESGVARRLRPGERYYVRTRFDLMLYLMGPVIAIMAGLMIFLRDPTTLVIMGVTTAGLTVLLLIFLNLEVKADREVLSFKFGHFGKELPLDRISSIGVTRVNALKDFMGYGVRIGPDGSIGYIVRGGEGFRVETDEGKRYVVSIPDPEGLVEYVRAAKTERERS
jgi:MFS family permease